MTPLAGSTLAVRLELAQRLDARQAAGSLVGPGARRGDAPARGGQGRLHAPAGRPAGDVAGFDRALDRDRTHAGVELGREGAQFLERDVLERLPALDAARDQPSDDL